MLTPVGRDSTGRDEAGSPVRDGSQTIAKPRTVTLPILVPEPRFELGRPCGPRSLSPLRLPFRHSGIATL
jgi:hypothetical protein